MGLLLNQLDTQNFVAPGNPGNATAYGFQDRRGADGLNKAVQFVTRAGQLNAVDTASYINNLATENIRSALDFSTLSVAISAESDVVELGGDMVLTAILTGFEDLNYTLQWQFSTDNVNWANVDGATDFTLRVQMNEENRDYSWRVSVDNISWKNPPVVQTVEKIV